jgi:hypothetical protein
VTHDPRFGDVVGDAELECLAQGFGFLEGPVWHPYEKWLVFSDIPNSRMHRRRQSGETEVFREPSQMANGNTLDRQGRLLSCEHATSRVTRAEADGSLRVLASHFGDKALNSPNDIVVAAGGSVYFTDPSYGRMPYYGVPRAQELSFQGVYRIDADGSVVLLADDFAQPNGLCFSLDESRLFVNDTERQHIRVDRSVLKNLRVDQTLDLFDFGVVERRVVGEIEAQAAGIDHAAGLLDMLAQHLAQRGVQQVGGGVVAHGIAPALHVHRSNGYIPHARFAAHHFADVDDHTRRRLAHAGHVDLPARLAQPADSISAQAQLKLP